MFIGKLRATLFILSIIFSCNLSYGSHLLGGEMTYRDTASGNCRITLKLYQDCLHGEPKAIEQDVPPKVNIYTKSGSLVNTLRLTTISKNQIPYTKNTNKCYNDTGEICVSEVTAIAEFTLPSSAEEYYAVYERCCWAEDISNINAPSGNGYGIKVHIAPTTAALPPNASPVFPNRPAARVCKGEPFSLDFGAMDPEGDSIIYELVPAIRGGAASNPLPDPSLSVGTPVSYAYGSSGSRPLGGAGNVSLNTANGRLTGTANQTGTYLFAVRAKEVRGGYTDLGPTRTYAIQVSDCGKQIISAIVSDSLAILAGISSTYIAQCDGNRTVRFRSASMPGVTYMWDFGVANRADDYSIEANPTFTYPSPGTYKATLTVQSGNCEDSSSATVIIASEQVTADFSAPEKVWIMTPALVKSQAGSSGSSIKS